MGSKSCSDQIACGFFYRLIQALITVTRLHVPVGAPVELISYISIRNQAVIGLSKSRNTSEPYHDNLCLFRCLALHEGEGDNVFSQLDAMINSLPQEEGKNSFWNERKNSTASYGKWLAVIGFNASCYDIIRKFLFKEIATTEIEEER
jgi:hypothetical protein